MNKISEQEHRFQSSTVEARPKLARKGNRIVRQIQGLLWFYLFVPPVLVLVLLFELGELHHRDGTTLSVCVSLAFYLLFGLILIKRVTRQIASKINGLQPVLADFSHELASPLVTLAGIIQTLSRQDKTELSRLELLERLKPCYERMASLHQDIRVLASWGESLKHSELSIFNPVQMAMACLAEIEERCESKGIKLIFSPSASQASAPSPLVVIADREAISRVLINLLENAWKYCPAGTTVTVSVNGTRENIRIEVCDNGPGLPADILQRVFERKFRGVASSPEAPSGSGLGIAIAKEIVECHGGRLAVESVVPCGLKFVISLPTIPARHPFMQLFDRV